MRVLRWINGVTKVNKIRNVHLRDRLKQEGVTVGKGTAVEMEAKVRGD